MSGDTAVNEVRTTHNGPWREKGEDGKYLSDDSQWSADFDGRPAGGTTAYVPILDTNGTTVALVVSEGWDDSDMVANARLIAAAPELLAALEEIAGNLAIPNTANPNVLLEAIEKVATAAIAKAEGRS